MPLHESSQPSPADRLPSGARRPRHRRRLRGIATLGALTIGASLVLPASAQTLPQPEVAEPSEILANGGFDAWDGFNHPQGWSVTGSDATVIQRAADRTAGPGSLEVRNPQGSGVTVMSRREIATAGSDYTLTGKAKVRSGTGAGVLLRFYDFNKKMLDQFSFTPTSTGDFEEFTVTGTAPEGTDLVAVLIAGSSATTGVTVFDEFSLDGETTAYDARLTDNRELFLDDYRIESTHDVQRQVHPGTKLPAPVIKAEKPWEDSAYTYGSVYKVDEKYRLWYTCYNDVAPNYHLCYAESRDGKRWDKPNLGLYEWNGSTDNNIVRGGSGTIAYNPTAPAAERYALLTYRAGSVADGTQGYYGMVSPDGLQWTDVSDQPLLLDGDVSNLTWDAGSGQYIASIKKRMFTADTGGYDRSAFVSTSADFRTWSNPQLSVMGDWADDGGAMAIGGLEGQIYGMPVLPYEGMYIGVPWVFDILNFTSGEYATAADGPITPQLAASRDLLHWERPVRDALIEPSLAGAWDDGALYTASNIIVDDKTISMYYAGFNNGHGGAEADNPDRDNHVGQTGLATWRRDGFVSLTNASTEDFGDAGEIITKPIVFDGSDLHVNATVRSGGSLTVDVLDADGNPIPGFTSKSVRGDRLDAKVLFGRAKLSTLQGTEIKLRFTVVNADLYSYWVN